jgi:ABC-type oligopeptide transport system ATPase subunit
MNVTLIIENFGPIKKMSFNFKKINILIGDQGTGKSTVAKLICAINKMAAGETLITGSRLMRKDEYGGLAHFRRHLKFFEIESYLSELTEITYHHGMFEFLLKNEVSTLRLTKDVHGQEIPIGQLNTTFIPADRAAVNLLSNELLLSLNELNQDLPGYFVRFGQLFNRAKKNLDKYDFTDTLGVIYKYENNQDKIEITGEKQIKISDASSAIQTNIPMLVVLNHQLQSASLQGIYTEEFNMTIVEEPELNCFPSLQNAIVKYIIRCVHPFSADYLRRVFITTHSPYILSSLNNLMYAFETNKIKNVEVDSIISKNYWVNPEDVSAYLLLIDNDGTVCENIMDEELKQIKVEKIDEISELLSIQWHQLADLNFDK